MKLLNIKTYTCNHTGKKVPVIPAKSLIQIDAGNKHLVGIVMGIYKSKPKSLKGKYEYTYIIKFI